MRAGDDDARGGSGRRYVVRRVWSSFATSAAMTQQQPMHMGQCRVAKSLHTPPWQKSVVRVRL